MNGAESFSIEVLTQNEKSMDLGDFSLLDISQLRTSPKNSLSSLEREEVQQRLAELLEDNQSMKEALQLNNTMMREQLNTISAWHTQMTSSMSRQQLNLQDATAQVARLEEEKKQLDAKVQVLEDDNQKMMISMKANEEQSINPPEEFEFITQKQAEDMQALKKKLEDVEKQLEEKNETENLKVNLANAVIKELQRGVALLQEKESEREKQLESLEKVLEEEKSNHSITLQSLNTVQANYDRVNRLLEIQTLENQTKESSSIEMELKERQHQEDIDDLTAHLLDLEQKLEEKTEQNKAINDELMSLREDAKQMDKLKTELELQKSETERTLLGASQNEEVSGSPSNGVSRHFRGRRGSHSRKEGGAWRQLDSNVIICPICNFGFTDLQAAENHVNNCIDGPNV